MASSAQGGFGLELKMNGTAIARIVDLDRLRVTKQLMEITGFDSPGGYYDAIPANLRRIEPFYCTLVWDREKATHDAVVTAFSAKAASSFVWTDPDADETIEFSARIGSISRISEQNSAYVARVEIRPTGKLTIVPLYYKRVLATSPSNLVAYWPMWETSGSDAAQLAATAIPDGAYYGVTLADTLGPDGMFYAPRWDAVNDYLNIYSSAFNTAWVGGVGDEGTIMIWVKSDDAFATSEGWMYRIHATNDYFTSYKQHFDGTPDKFESLMERITTLRHTVTGSGLSGWVFIAQSWKYPGTFRTFWNGAYYAQSTANGPWTNSLATEYVVIGNSRAHVMANTGWGGWIAHCAIWDVQLSDAVLEGLAVV